LTWVFVRLAFTSLPSTSVNFENFHKFNFLPSWILFSWSSICSTQFKKLIKCKVWSRKYQSFQNMRKYSKKKFNQKVRTRRYKHFHFIFKKYSILFFNDKDKDKVQIMKLRIQILRIKKFITNFQRKIKELLLADWNFFPNLGVNYNNFLHSNSKTILSPLSFASSSLFSELKCKPKTVFGLGLCF
jgi:hypothetical protein